MYLEKYLIQESYSSYTVHNIIFIRQDINDNILIIYNDIIYINI